MNSLAITWTRPETVREDAARALAMIGFAPAPVDGTAVLPCLDDDSRESGRSTAPWHTAAALSYIKASGGDLPTSRLTPRTTVVLHLPFATLHEILGSAGCLRALAVTSDRKPETADPLAAVLDAARDALDTDRETAFLLDATLAPGIPEAGAPLRPRNVLMAGRDPVAMDAAVARLVGVDPASLPLLVRAAAAGLGEVDLSRLDLRGDRDDLLNRSCEPWRPAPDRGPGRALLRAWRAVSGFGRKSRTEMSPWHELWLSSPEESPSHTEAFRHA